MQRRDSPRRLREIDDVTSGAVDGTAVTSGAVGGTAVSTDAVPETGTVPPGQQSM